MAAFYNAVVRDANNKIIARTRLTDPTNVPWEWKISYGEKEIQYADEIKDYLCDPSKPLNISRRKLISDGKGQRPVGDKKQHKSFDVHLKFHDVVIKLPVKGYTTLQDLAFMLKRQCGTLLRRMRFDVQGFKGKNGKTLEDGTTMADLGMDNDDNFFDCRFNNLKVRSKVAGIGIASESYEIHVKRLTGKIIPLKVDSHLYIEDVKYLVQEAEGTPPDQHRLIYAGMNLEGDRTLADYNIPTDGTGTIYMVLNLRGGGGGGHSGPPSGLKFANLEGQLQRGRGVSFANQEDNWMAYGRGLNFKGDCENYFCKSQRYPGRNLAIYTFGFGLTTLTKETRFCCPACNKLTLKPGNFLIAGARCAFRFKETGENLVKTMTLGSGPFPKYVELNDQDEEDTKEYEFIEILSTDYKKSPHECILCGEGIGNYKREETIKSHPCGHYCHRSCKRVVKECPLCLAEDVLETSIKDLAGMSLEP